MGNDSTSERLWILDTAAIIVACGIPVIIRKLVFFPALKDDDVVIQDYGPLAALRTAIRLKAGNSDTSPVSLDFGITGLNLNGFKLATIDGGSLDVYIGRL